MYSFRKSKKGFTLIELMVVVAIIAVLALLGLRLYSTQQTKAKEAIVKANAGSTQVTIQTELVDTPGLLLQAALDLTDLDALRNPFDSGVFAVIQTAGDTPLEGQVGVTQDASTLIFKINGYGEDADLIVNYELTAQR